MNVESVGAGGTADGDILRRVRAGDERAFLALYRAAQPGLLRYLTVIAGDAAALLATQTWAEVSQDLVDFSGTLDEFRTWVAGVGRRRALDYLERARSGAAQGQAQARSATPPAPGPVRIDLTRVELAEDAAGSTSYATAHLLPGNQQTATTPAATTQASRPHATNPQTESALRMIGDLPQNEAEAVLLRSVMGFDDAATASVLGVRRAAVRRTALRGLRALSRRLEAAAAGHGGAGDADALEVLEEPAVRVLRVVPEPAPRMSPAPGQPRATDRTAIWPADPMPRVVNCDATGTRGLEVSH